MYENTGAGGWGSGFRTDAASRCQVSVFRVQGSAQQLPTPDTRDPKPETYRLTPMKHTLSPWKLAGLIATAAIVLSFPAAYWRDARLTKIFEGTSEIMQRIISDRIMGK